MPLYKISYMNYIVCLLFLALLSSQCQKKQTDAQNQIHWNKILIKGEITVSAIYGNIFEKMIIGTNQNILETTDSGRTWKTVAANVDKIDQFDNEGDTLFAISLGKDYFSLNNGNEWHLLAYDRIRNYNTQVSTSKGDLYKFILTSVGEQGLPAEVQHSSDNGVSWQNVFPFKNYIMSIYADKQDKIYLGAWGVTWDESKSYFVELKNPEDAILYYSYNSK